MSPESLAPQKFYQEAGHSVRHTMKVRIWGLLKLLAQRPWVHSILRFKPWSTLYIYREMFLRAIFIAFLFPSEPLGTSTFKIPCDFESWNDMRGYTWVKTNLFSLLCFSSFYSVCSDSIVNLLDLMTLSVTGNRNGPEWN